MPKPPAGLPDHFQQGHTTAVKSKLPHCRPGRSSTVLPHYPCFVPNESNTAVVKNSRPLSENSVFLLLPSSPLWWSRYFYAASCVCFKLDAPCCTTPLVARGDPKRISLFFIVLGVYHSLELRGFKKKQNPDGFFSRFIGTSQSRSCRDG